MTLKSICKILNILFFVGIVTTFAYRMILSDSVATAGVNLISYDEQISTMQQEIEVLQKQYLDVTSLSRLSQTAYEKGYVNAQFEYYSSPELAAATD